MNSRWQWWRLLGIVPILTLLPCARAATLTIGQAASRRVPAELFGQFLERPSWGGEYGPEAVCNPQGGFPTIINEYLAGMHTTLVRFPTGTDGDYIDWTDMIDLPVRARRPETLGHTGKAVTNRFGFNEYFALAQRMNWKTIVVTNLRDALYKKKPLTTAAAHAAALAAYAGAWPEQDPSGWAAQRARNGMANPISLFAVQVGNEGWFFWPPKPEELARLGLADDEACTRWLRDCLVAYADAIHAILPDIPLIADAPRPLNGGGSMREVAVWRAAVDHPDIRSRYRYLAAHAYAPMGFWHTELAGQKIATETLTADQIWYGLLATLGRFDSSGQAMADSTAYNDIQSLGYRAAVTEWNWNGWNYTKLFPHLTFREGLPAALSTAGFLHGIMRHPNVDLATQSMLLGTSWGITAVRVAGDGSVGYLPQAEVTRLYAEHHGTEQIACSLEGNGVVTSIPRFATWWPLVNRLALLDAVATSDSTALYLHLINRDRTQSVPLQVILPRDEAESGQATIHQLTGTNQTATTSAGGMLRVQTQVPWDRQTLVLVLPAASVTIAVLPRPPLCRPRIAPQR